jgi:hypothetical protein
MQAYAAMVVILQLLLKIIFQKWKYLSYYYNASYSTLIIKLV